MKYDARHQKYDMFKKKKKKKDIHLHRDSNKYAAFRILSDHNDNHVNIKLNLIVVKKFNALH